MLRKLLFLVLFGGGFFACKDDDEIRFEVPTEFRKIHFDAMPGGAVMHYYLPNETEIFGVLVRYTNAWGEEQLKSGTYLSDSLVLDGFTEARTNVPAQLTFINRDMAESEPIEMTFDTEESATVAVFNNLSVNAFWGGFNVTYDAPETVNGIIHVFYLGTNPLTHEPDSILMASVPIVEGGDTLNFVPQQVMDSIDVVVRTDDYRGRRVKQMVVAGIPSLSMDTLSYPDDFAFEFTGEHLENVEFGFSQDYLFDGDKRGDGRRAHLLAGEKYKYSTYVAGPNAFYDADEPTQNRFIFDLKKERVPAAVNLYAFLYYGGSGYPYRNADYPLPSDVWSGYYPTRLPAKIHLYGTNADDPKSVDLSTCAHLFTLDDDVVWESGFENSWAKLTDHYSTPNYNIWGMNGSYLTATDEELEAAPPVMLNMLCNYTGAAYRYLIFVVEDTYDSLRAGGQEENQLQYVTINELEVCIKAEAE